MFWKRPKTEQGKAPAAPVVVWHKPKAEYYNIAAAAIKAEHTLIAGSTGCGKSTFLRSVVQALLSTCSPAEADLIVIDPKCTDLWRLDGLPQVRAYTDSKQAALRILEEVEAEIIAKQRQARAAGLDEYQGKALYILIDELNPLVRDKQIGKQIAAAIEQIVTLGRSSRVHLIAATQNPNRQTIPGNMADNCTCRFGLKCQTSYQSRAIVGQTGCEKLPRHGVALADLGGDFGAYAIPNVTPEDLRPLIAYWKSPASRSYKN